MYTKLEEGQKAVDNGREEVEEVHHCNVTGFHYFNIHKSEYPISPTSSLENCQITKWDKSKRKQIWGKLGNIESFINFRRNV